VKKCLETAESCTNKSNEQEFYEWLAAKEGECCGMCKKLESNCFYIH
jgi:hypothetical protein